MTEVEQLVIPVNEKLYNGCRNYVSEHTVSALIGFEIRVKENIKKRI
jgi:hypothetical protein